MERKIEMLEREIRAAEAVWNNAFRLIILIILLGLVFMCSSVIDMYRFTNQGLGTIEYHDFKTLIGINPDTVAWITLDDSNINHPVVQGEDNFRYLDVDFYGETYAGGSIFLDAGNSSDFSDEYNLIHGHHMEHGAMFGDLEKYMKQDYADKCGKGELLTPDSKYRLRVAAAGVFDAYDMNVYSTGNHDQSLSLLDRCEVRCDVRFQDTDKLLALSTCSGNMSNDRIVVFCRMRYAGRNT